MYRHNSFYALTKQQLSYFLCFVLVYANHILERIVFLFSSLMEQISIMFAETRETEIVLAPIVQAGLDALKV